MADKSLLRVKDLKLYFKTTRGVVQAVDGVDFDSGPQRSHRDPRRIGLR